MKPTLPGPRASQSRTAGGQRVLVLDMPHGGVREILDMHPNNYLRLAFDLDGIKIVKSGQNLVFTDLDNNSLVLRNFFDILAERAGHGIRYGMEENESLTMADLLAVFSPELIFTGADKVAVTSNGFSAYTDAAGTLTKGVQALKAHTQEDRENETPDVRVADAASSSGGHNSVAANGGNGAALDAGGTMDSGAGNDRLSLFSAENNSTASPGQGDDLLRLDGLAGTSLITGSGKLDDSLNDLLDFDQGRFGDILSLAPNLAGNQSDNAVLDDLTASNTLNLESLHLDLDNGGADSLSLDDLLKTLDSTSGGDNACKRLVVTGDEHDLVQGLDGASQNQSGASLDGFDGLTFDRYTVVNGADTVEIYIQSGMI